MLDMLIFRKLISKVKFLEETSILKSLVRAVDRIRKHKERILERQKTENYSMWYIGGSNKGEKDNIYSSSTELIKLVWLRFTKPHSVQYI